MRIVCFIGSGFNYMLADIVKPQNVYTKDDIPLHEKIISLNKLWQEFENPLIQLNSFIPNRYGEHMLEALDNIESMLQNSSTKSNDLPTNSYPTYSILNRFIKDHLIKVGMRFTEFERNGGYSIINSAFNNLGGAIKSTLDRNNVNNFYLCTTNYDGITDSLLTYLCKDESKRKFLLKDGFINGKFNNTLFERFNYRVAHIHGSYRYFDSSNDTIKLEKETINNNPLMIYGNPYRKEASILGNHVLAVYYSELKRMLTKCDKVITIGNSFSAEPHLLTLIKNTCNRPNNQMVVCSDKPHDVASILESYYDYPIYTQSTKHVQSEEQLINLLNQLLSSTGVNMLATA